MGDSLLDKRLILITGKGGVGRSTVAAAVAAACARRGRKTLLVEANANDRYSSFFNSPPIGTKIVRLRENLHAVNTNPAAALEEYGLMVLRFRRVYRMVFENRVTRSFLRAIPGLDDYSIIGKVWFHTEEMNRGNPVWDTVVFDMPASGHSMSMLRIPWVILKTVPEGPLTRDARSLVSLLRDPARCALTLVTLAEEMPANEARDLHEAVGGEFGIQTAHLFVNQVYPNRFPDGSPSAQVLQALESDPGADPCLQALHAHAALANGRRKLNEHYLRQLTQSIEASRSELPMLFAPSLGQTEIDTLSQLIGRDVG